MDTYDHVVCSGVQLTPPACGLASSGSRAGGAAAAAAIGDMPKLTIRASGHSAPAAGENALGYAA
eukprot:CAMPEP_0204069790 /NCGR_PEP_ID=MMETSP0360-20130528/157454_1 /ASSEMBLY_ACC=CAM_ASM_000342 /TAXON_ID=268821 /ORGANISM="Scrippsiella Hangoei, Strain SHTV-5" /LENGTH=64 /DNA_ID=CAMNT_0051017975 /DNA_START=82 /DNA_END=274 /DNA_ORIENTATION=-